MMKTTKNFMRLLGMAALFASLALVGCSSDDDSSGGGGGGSFAYTDNDSLPELTGVPVLNPASVDTSATTVTVNIPVDSDTSHLQVRLYSSTGVESGFADWPTASSSVHTETVDITVSSLAVDSYTVDVIACNNAMVTGSTCGTSAGVWYGTSSTVTGTYVKLDITGTSPIETGVALATLTVTEVGGGGGGGGGFTSTDGDSLPELTGVPVLNPASVDTSATTVTVEIPVDSDTSHLEVRLYSSTGVESGFADWPTASSSVHTETVDITVSSLAVGSYTVDVIACTNAMVTGSTCGTSEGVWYGESSTVAGTYVKFDMTGASPIETGVALATLTVTAAPAATISTDMANPTPLALDTPTVFTMPNSQDAYIDIPDTPGVSSEGFGVYITGATPSLAIGYDGGGFWAGGIVGIKDLTANTVRAGVQGSAGTADYLAMLSNFSGADVTFTVTIKKGTMGGANAGSAITGTLDAPTWIGGTFNSGFFGPFIVGTNGNVLVDFTDLNQGGKYSVTDSASATLTDTSATACSVTGVAADTTGSLTCALGTGAAGTEVYVRAHNNFSTIGPIVGSMTVSTD